MQEKDKKILEKIKNKPFITAKGISDDVKSNFYISLSKEGMSNGTINRRIFLVGFKEWERMGIDNVIANFAALNDLGNIDVTNILPILTSKRGLRERFYTYMTNRGMSRITCMKRFMPGAEWYHWERVGIKSIIEEMEKNLI